MTKRHGQRISLANFDRLHVAFDSQLFTGATLQNCNAIMSSTIQPRAAPSLPVNETAHFSPMRSLKGPSKTFSKIVSHLKLEHDHSSQKPEVPKPSSIRPASSQSCNVNTFTVDTPRLMTPRTSIREPQKASSTIMSHCTILSPHHTSSSPPQKVSYIDPPPIVLKPIPRPKPSKTPARPNYSTQPSAQTRYVDMLLDMDNIPRSHNLLASFSTWILLAGFIVVPGTFVSVEDNKTLQKGAKNSKVEHAVLDTVKHASLIWVAGFCCLVGSAGMVWLWWRWRSNYVWLINKIFL